MGLVKTVAALVAIWIFVDMVNIGAEISARDLFFGLCVIMAGFIAHKE